MTDAARAAGQPLAAGWYRIGVALPETMAEDAPRLVIDRIDGVGGGAFPMRRARRAAELVVALPAGHYALSVEGTGERPSAIRIGRGDAFRSMLATLLRGPAPAGAWERLRAVLGVLPGLRRGARGFGDALVAAYRGRLAGEAHRRLGLPTGRLLGQGSPFAGSMDLLLQPEGEALHAGGQAVAIVDAAVRDYVLRRAAPGAAFAAGWYLLETDWGDADALRPRATMPSPQATAERSILLPEQAAAGRRRWLLLLDGEASALRLTPAWSQEGLALRSVRLHRVGRPRALWTMLRGVSVGADDAGRPRTLGGAVRGFLDEASRRGRGEAADALFRRYCRRSGLGIDAYDAWTRSFDTFRKSDLARMRARGEALAEHGPLISVLVPTYDTPEPWLRRCIDSVRAQCYPRWELCIADDASPAPWVAKVLAEYAARDARIRVVRRERNGHISEASNSALELAQGDYVALLDHDDELRPHALLEMAEAIVADPALELLYSDEDKLDADGHRFDPYFKPDWDPDLLRGQNYVCHLSVLRTERVRAVGGFRTGFEGSQDHDLVLRCSEGLDPARIRHIPKVLYHWRAIAGSTALTRDAKDYAAAAGVRAVGEHLARRHPGARAEELSHGHYRVRWPLPARPPKVSLLVPTRDRVELLRTCVESVLERTAYPSYEIVVIDNQSADPDALAYLDALRRRERVKVLRDDAPFNYSRINNRAAAQCDGELLALLNNDIEVLSPDWLSEMAAHASRPEIGAVGAMLYYPDDTIQHAGVVLGIHGVAAHVYCGMPRGYPGQGGRARVAQRLSAVTGACLLVRRAVYDAVGGLDERLQVAFNDIDFCLRVREAGYHNLWTPFAELYHHESASRGREDTDEKRARFVGEVETMLARWGPQLQADPAYNPNLSLASLNFEYAFPPRIAAR